MNNLFLAIHSLIMTTAVPDSTTVAYQINQFFNTMVSHLGQVGESIEGNFATDVAQQVAAICVLFYLGWEMWPVIMGRKAPDVTKLLRPVLIAGVISAWPFFFLMFENVKTGLADGAKQLYNSQQNSIMIAEKNMALKIEKIDSIRKKDLVTYLAANSNLDGLDKTSLESKDYAELRDDYIDNEIKEGRQNRFAAGMIEFANFISTMIENILKWIGQIALQAFFCGILVVGDFGTIVMGIFGPIMFALSISTAFKNHWAKWIEKYLCIALYPCLGYLCMAYVNWMILYYLEVQCNIGDTAISDWEKFVSVSYNHFGLIINYLVALFTGTYVMQAVPDLARAIFPGPSGHAASSAGMFVSGMTMATGGAAVKVATTAIKTTVGTAGAAVGAAVSDLKSGKGDAMKDANHHQKSQNNKDERSDKESGPTQKDEAKAAIRDYINPFRWLKTPLLFGAAKELYHEADKAERKNRRKSEIKNSQGAKKENRYSNNYKKGKEDGKAFGYTRTGSSRHKGSSYNPSANDRYTRRGEGIRLPKFRHNFSPAKLRHYWGTSMEFLANFVLADETNVNPQAWASAVGSIKSGARTLYSVPWIFAKHYQKHQANGTYQNIRRWQNERSSDMVFVRRPAVGGYVYQTYGEEAQNLAKLTGEKVRYIKVGGQKIASFTLNRHNLLPVIHRLNELGISVNVINQKGKSIYYKDDISFTKLDALDNIRKTLTKQGGDVQFQTAKSGFHTEMTGNGFNDRHDDEISILGIVTDAYGALHMMVKDNNGNTQKVYLDRLKEEDLQKLAGMLEGMAESEDNELKVIKYDEKDNELDNINDEFGFAKNEEKEYGQQSNVRENGFDRTDSETPTKQATDSDITGNTQNKEGKTENDRKEDDKNKSPHFIDPMQQLKEEWSQINVSPLGEWKRSFGKTASTIGGIAVAMMEKYKWSRWMVNIGRNTHSAASSFMGWSDNTKADVQKDLRAGIEYRWNFRVMVKDNTDFRRKQRSIPLAVSLKRSKQQVIRRGRGIHFAGVDFRQRSGFRKVAHNGWRFTKWSAKTAANTGIYALKVATGQRPLISISAVGAWGFKKSYNGIRWMARQNTARNAVIAWKREDKHNYVIVNRSGLKGNRYQTYGEDAVAIARILHKEQELRMLHLGQGHNFWSGRFFEKNIVPSLTLTKDEMARLKAILDGRGLTMDVISTRGHSLLNGKNELSAALGIHHGPATQQTTGGHNDQETNANGTVPPSGVATGGSPQHRQDATVHGATQHPQDTGGTPQGTSQSSQPTDSDDQQVHNGPDGQNGPQAQPNPANPNGHPTSLDPADNDGEQKPTPVVLDFSQKDPAVPDKTFELKDIYGNILYLVTGESLKSCLERMVKKGYSLKGLDLTNADLRDANLKGADLRDADLTKANLRGARLQKADLTNADLTEANLRVANLNKANLTDAWLSNADLRDANLKKVNTTNTNFSGADLRGTDLDNKIIL